MKKPPRNMAASVRERLLQQARATGRTNGELLDRYCIERLLYRLSRSRHRERFILKGALLLTVWGGGGVQRITRDADLLGFGDGSPAALADAFREICATPVEEDGVVFDLDAIRTDGIRAREEYAGVRVELRARLGSAVVRVQVDVGFGDAVKPVEVTLPCLLGLPPPVLRAYRREQAVAEKFEALVKLGMANSRMKDYFDFWHLARGFGFDGEELAAAVRTTFRRRGSGLPAGCPDGLGDEFAQEAGKQAQWRGFWRKAVRAEPRPELAEVVALAREFLLPVAAAGRRGEPFPRRWPPGGPWRQMD